MKVELQAEFKFSKPITKEAEKEIKKFLEDTNKNAFKKGAKEDKEATHLAEWKIKKDTLILNLKSGGQVRAHDAVLRLRKPLAEFMGKKYKTGLKESAIKNAKIEIDIEEKPEKTIKLPFVKKITFKNKTATLELEDLNDIALERNYPAKIANRLLAKISAQKITGKADTEKVVRESPKKISKYIFKQDPTQELIDKGWIKEYPGAGVWLIMPPFAALIKAIQQLFIDTVAKPMGFQEIILPRLIPLEVERKKGHLAIAHECFWVCPPAKRDPEFFEDYVDYVEITGETAPEQLMQKLRAPMFGLAYAQCEPFYEIFDKETVDTAKLPFKFYDINGPTWRWEAGGVKGLERLNEFLRIELVYLGTKEQVKETRDELLKKSEEIMDKIFDVEYRVDACTPVYLEHAGIVEKDKEGFVKTYDLVAILPFKTASKEESELEISSYHIHKDFYMNRFHTKERHNKEIWTGCTGIGPSRWAFLFLLRHGMDYSKWPAEIRKYIGNTLPPTPELVSWPKKKKV